MGDRLVEGGGGQPRREAFTARLRRQAGHRWLMLAGAMVVLLWLGAFAGHVRNPDAVKRQWAVLVSRILAGAGAIILVRLLLVSYEERVPVLFFDLHVGTGSEGTLGRIADVVRGLKDRGYEVVPLDDVVEFVREQRYVPRKCIGLVLEANGMADLVEIATALPGLNITVLLPPEAGKDATACSRISELPPEVSLGLSLAANGGRCDYAGLMGLLGGFRESIAGFAGRKPCFARLGPVRSIDLRRLLKETAYACFLDGSGFNRFGDEPHLLRLLDATAFVTGESGVKGLAVYIGLYKGKYYLWPLAAMMWLAGSRSKGA